MRNKRAGGRGKLQLWKWVPEAFGAIIITDGGGTGAASRSYWAWYG